MNKAKQILDQLVEETDDGSIQFQTEVDDIDLDGGGSDLALFDPYDASATVKWNLRLDLTPQGVSGLDKQIERVIIRAVEGSIDSANQEIKLLVGETSSRSGEIIPTRVTYNPRQNVITVYF